MQANKHSREAFNYKLTDEVILPTKNLPAAFHQSKLAPKWMGPFTIIDFIMWSQNVKLDLSVLPDLHYITNALHTSLIKPSIANDDVKFTNSKLNKSGPVAVAPWEIVRVLEFRFKRATRQPQYEVKWKGYHH